jgi:hypothetical protein
VPVQDQLAFVPPQPPSYCEYSGAECDQSLSTRLHADGFFLYPSQPEIIASTVESAAVQLRHFHPGRQWLTWKDLNIPGQIIFCRICEAIRAARNVIADVTTLNFNLLFEIGYAIGAGIGVFPIRDTNYAVDRKEFDELGMLDTLGYVNFANSTELARAISSSQAQPLPVQTYAMNREQPLYVVRSHVQSEGMVKLMSALKKSGLRFRTFDPRETARLSLHEAMKQVQTSLGVIVHLLAPERTGACVNNARCALVAGLAMALSKQVLILQEGDVPQPIDYRDVVRPYTNPSQVPELLLPIIKNVVETLQESQFVAVALPLNLIEKVDLGDLAAENEIRGLGAYFVPTGQYNEAKRGRARIVVGRKGSGKTAIFYGIRSTYKPSKAHLVLDLKPEGHQFTKLREAVLQSLSPGVQQHVLTAFWNYILLMEIARKVLEEEARTSYDSRDRRAAWLRVAEAYGTDLQAEQGDFSERLLSLVGDIVARRAGLQSIAGTPEVTELVYGRDIRVLSDALSDYIAISRKDDIWVLFDNLDKGWPVHSATPEDILLLRSVLEATRKLQRQFENRGTDCHAIIFIRNDIYEHLVRETPDRGKDTAVILDWNDPEVFKEIIRRRIMRSTGLEGDFEQLWPLVFETHVLGEESFSYILSRTLMRPREVLRFCRECLDVAVNRGHERVSESDILQAEKLYSGDALVDVSFELKDVDGRFTDLPYAFIGAAVPCATADVDRRLVVAGLEERECARAVDLLLWFGFLGYSIFPDEERFSYQFQHDLRKMKSGMPSEYAFTVHPAFRKALGCTGA